MPLTNTERTIRARETKTRAASRSREVDARPSSKAAEAADAKAAAEKKSK